MESLLDLFDSHEGSSSPPPSSPISSSLSPPSDQPLPSCLPPEVEEGNVEYKLKLLNPTASRFEHLVTQMKWRLREGQGEAIYEIGVADSGVLQGLTDRDMEDSLSTLKRMADKLGATVTTLRHKEVNTGAKKRGRKMSVTEVLVRKVPDDQEFLDVRVAVLGPAEGGKSTLLGVLTQGELDNGRGRARLNLFRHLHEIQSGRTSSISHEILGFSASGDVVNYSTCVSAEEICEASSKLVTLIDLAGHYKYLKTTVFGLTAHRPDFAMLMVGANSGVVGTTCEHLGISIALRMPVLVVVTKVDLCPPAVIQRTLTHLEELLKSPGCCKVPLRVNSNSDTCTAAQKFITNDIAPIFLISSVTGQGLDLLRQFLNLVPPVHSHHEREQLELEHTEFHVDVIYRVPDAGTVLGGVLTRGVVREGDSVLVGPREDGRLCEERVTTIRRNRTPCRMVRAGQAATITITHQAVEKTDMRKGTVLLSPSLAFTDMANSSLEFEADATVYVASVMQTAVIEDIQGKETLNVGESGRVKFKFLCRPEFLRVGWRVLFREGMTKGIGEITGLTVLRTEQMSTVRSKPHR